MRTKVFFITILVLFFGLFCNAQSRRSDISLNQKSNSIRIGAGVFYTNILPTGYSPYNFHVGYLFQGKRHSELSFNFSYDKGELRRTSGFIQFFNQKQWFTLGTSFNWTALKINLGQNVKLISRVSNQLGYLRYYKDTFKSPIHPYIYANSIFYKGGLELEMFAFNGILGDKNIALAFNYAFVQPQYSWIKREYTTSEVVKYSDFFRNKQRKTMSLILKFGF